MRSIVRTAALLSLVTLLAVAQQDAAQQVQEAELGRVKALVAGDYATVERYLDDDLHYTHSTAWVQTKEQFLADLRSGTMSYEKMEHSDLRVRVYGGAAVISGHSAVRVRSPRAPGGVIEMEMRFTAVYVNRGGQWRMTAWQSTRIPEAAPASR